MRNPEKQRVEPGRHASQSPVPVARDYASERDSLGSSKSRRLSPITLTDRTVSVRNTPGNPITQMAWEMVRRPSAIMLPQLGIEPGRFHLEWVSSAEAPKWAKLARDFTEQVRALGPLDWAGSVLEAQGVPNVMKQAHVEEVSA